MKKTMFAAKVFALIAMLPIVVILEFNHGAGDPSKNNSPSGVIDKTEKSIIRLPEKTEDKLSDKALSVRLLPAEQFFDLAVA